MPRKKDMRKGVYGGVLAAKVEEITSLATRGFTPKQIDEALRLGRYLPYYAEIARHDAIRYLIKRVMGKAVSHKTKNQFELERNTEIWRRRQDGEKAVDLAKEYKLKPSSIRRIVVTTRRRVMRNLRGKNP